MCLLRVEKPLARVSQLFVRWGRRVSKEQPPAISGGGSGFKNEARAFILPRRAVVTDQSSRGGEQQCVVLFGCRRRWKEDIVRRERDPAKQSVEIETPL